MIDDTDGKDGARMMPLSGAQDGPAQDVDVVVQAAMYLGRALEWAINARRFDICSEIETICAEAFAQVHLHQETLAEEARQEGSGKENIKEELLN